MRFLKKVYSRLRKAIYRRDFAQFNVSSEIEAGCRFAGKNRISIGKDTFIGQGSEILALNSHYSQELQSDLQIGNHVRITARCRIVCACKVEIGNDVLIAPDVFIIDNDHGMEASWDGGYSPQPLLLGKVKIEDGVWIGRGVTVLRDSFIGAHSIIGAESVVKGNIPEYSMAVGCPAKVIKKWDKNSKTWTRTV